MVPASGKVRYGRRFIDLPSNAALCGVCAGAEQGPPKIKRAPFRGAQMGKSMRGALQFSGSLTPVAAAAPAAVIPRAGIVCAEVGAAHIAVAKTRLRCIRGRYHTAGAVAAIKEMMRQF